MPYGYFPRRTNLGEQLGAGIAGFAENFRQAREGVRERRIQDEERQRAGAIQNYELAQRGVHITGTNPLPSAVELGMAQDRANQGTASIEAARRAMPQTSFQTTVRNAMGNAAGSQLQYTPAASPEPDTRKSGTFIDQLRESLVGPPPPKQDRYQVGPGYYVDTEEAAKNQEPAQYAARSNAFQQAITPALVQMMTRQDPVEVHKAERLFDVEHPLPTQPGSQYTFPTGTDAEGNPVVLRANTRTGAVEPTVVGAKPAGSQQPTDFERKAAMLAPRAQQALEQLREFYKNGAPLKAGAGKIPIVGNYVLSADEQRLNQASEELASAILRLESGANINESEIKSMAQQLKPLAGDKPEVRERKQKTAELAVQQMIDAATRATAANAKNAAAAPPANHATPVLPPLTAQQKARAKADADYAAFLKAKGYQ